MRSKLRTWPIVALLLSLLLPLQGFAAVSGCAPRPAAQHGQQQTPMAHEHCAAHASPDSTTPHHPSCSDCCMAAVATTPPQWTPPRCETLHPSLPEIRTPLKISLDRLDRPPRTLPV
jgi:hypothetical protein